MREILFRGKSTETGKWREGCLLNVTLDGVTYNLIFGDDFARSGTGVTAMAHSCVYPETVGQYTGLTDQNGKKIFEGDIVVYDNTPYNAYGQRVTGVIVWHKWEWKFRYKEDGSVYHYAVGAEDFFGAKSEVIGTIHDNPEFLED